MDRDTVIALAREAGAVFPADGSWHKFEVEGSLERFATLVAAHEREECAKLAGDFAVDLEDVWVCEKLAAAIRSRT